MIEGPVTLNPDANATFTCKTLSTYKTSVDMVFRVVSNEIDFFDDLDQAGFAVVEDNPVGIGEVEFSRTLTIKPELVMNHCYVGMAFVIDCAIAESCHGKRVYNSISKMMSLQGKMMYTVKSRVLMRVTKSKNIFMSQYIRVKHLLYTQSVKARAWPRRL